MSIDEQNCNDCGAIDWVEMLSNSYPDHRQEREQTVETVFKCAECGAQGKQFEDGLEGTVQYSGAMR